MIPILNMKGEEEQGTTSYPKVTLELTAGCAHYHIYQRLLLFFLTVKQRLTHKVLARHNKAKQKLWFWNPRPMMF